MCALWIPDWIGPRDTSRDGCDDAELQAVRRDVGDECGRHGSPSLINRSSARRSFTLRLASFARWTRSGRAEPSNIRVTPDGDEVELRLSSIPTALGEKMVMRIFDPSVLLRNFTELGLNPQEINIWQSLVTQPHGIVLVTGPTGSGKTTTLYSTLKQLARPEVKMNGSCGRRLTALTSISRRAAWDAISAAAVIGGSHHG